MIATEETLPRAPGGREAVRAPLPPEPQRPGRRPRRAGLAPAVLLVPATAVLAAIIGWPLIQLLIMSFQEYGRAQVFGAPAPFIGLGNYVTVLGDQQFWDVLARSLLYCVVCVVITIALGTLVALLLSRLGKGMRLLVSIGLLLAWAMPPLSATIVWGWIFDTQFGVVNYVLTHLTGVDFTGHSWLIDPVSFYFVATIIIVWGAVPFVAFTLYAGLTQVPTEVIEASQLDGAAAPARFRLVVLPYLQPIYVVLIILSVIWDLKVFTQIYALQTIGGIKELTSTIGVYIYQTSLANGEYGTGGAISVILVVLMMAISYYYVRLSLKEEKA